MLVQGYVRLVVRIGIGSLEAKQQGTLWLPPKLAVDEKHPAPTIYQTKYSFTSIALDLVHAQTITDPSSRCSFWPGACSSQVLLSSSKPEARKLERNESEEPFWPQETSESRELPKGTHHLLVVAFAFLA